MVMSYSDKDTIVSTRIVAADGSGQFTDIQEALNDLPATGGAVYVKDGTYTLDSVITIPNSNISIFGAGKSTKIEIADSAHGIYGEEKDYISFRDIYFTNADGASAGNCIRLNDCEGCFIESCWMDGSISGGVIFNIGTKESSVRNCNITGGATGIAILGNDNIIDGNFITGSVIGIFADDTCTRARIVNNIIESCTNRGMWVDDLNYSVLDSNLIRNSTDDGLLITDGDYNIISNNHIFDNGSNAITIAGTSTDNQLILNLFHNNTGADINDNGANTTIIHAKNGFLGIGTATPDTELHLVGSFKMVDGNEVVGRVLTCDAAGVGSWQAPATAGDVTAGANLTDEKIVQGDGGAKGVKTSTETIAHLTTAYNHSQDNSQAHSDYMLNTGDISTGGYTFGGEVLFKSAGTKFYSTEADKTDWRLTILTSDADLMKIYAYDEGAPAFLPIKLGGTTTAGVGLTIGADGRVAIGTASLDRELHVSDGASGATSNANSQIVIESGVNAALQLMSPNTANNYIFFGDPEDAYDGYIIYEHAARRMTLRAGATQILSLYDGKVGIGTQTPNYELEVASASTPQVIVHDTTNTIKNRISSDDVCGAIGTITAHDLKLQTGGATKIFVQHATGEVGIGTLTPNAKLDVRGSAIFNEDGADVDFRIEGGTYENLFFADAGQDRIGINTATPSYPLDVHGAGRFTGYLRAEGGLGIFNAEDDDALFTFDESSTSYYAAIFYIDDVGFDIGHNSSIRSLNLKTNSLDRLTITGAGRVGIGMIDPDYALEVAGTIYGTAIKGLTFFSSDNSQGVTTTVEVVGNVCVYGPDDFRQQKRTITIKDGLVTSVGTLGAAEQLQTCPA